MTDRSEQLGIDFLSVFGMPPVEFVKLTAELRCRYLSMGPEPLAKNNPHGYDHWSLRDDPSLKREVITALRDHDVQVEMGEGFLVRPGIDLADAGEGLDLMAELGTARMNVLTIDPDLGRSLDQFATFAELCAARGMESTLEFGPRLAIGTLEGALHAIDHVGRTDFRLTVDAMHFFRSGGTVEALRQVAPEKIGYVQLCDVPEVSAFDEYMDEARFERLAPGEGELPLADLVAALPSHVVCGLEVPMREKALTGVGPAERLGPCVAAARALLGG